MNRRITLHVLGAPVRSVLWRLGTCQSLDFLPKIDFSELKRQKEVDEQSALLTVLEILKKQKDKQVEFYSVDNRKSVSIISEFITFENAEQVAKSFFDDLNCFVMVFKEIESQVFSLQIIKKGKVLLDTNSTQLNDAVFLKICTLLKLPLSEKHSLISALSGHERLEKIIGGKLFITIDDLDLNSDNVFVEKFIVNA